MRRVAWQTVQVTLYGLILYALTFLLAAADPDPGNDVQVAGLFVAVLAYAIGLGVAAQLVFDCRRRLTMRAVTVRALIAVLLLAVLLAFVIAIETLICIVMALPLVLPFAVAGIWLTRRLLDRMRPNRLNASVLLALPLLVPLSGLPDPVRVETISITTTRIVEASADRIRALAENVSDIADSERPWTITHNLLGAPLPLSARTEGGIRHARWTKGVTFEEHLLPGPDLAWRFVFPDPDSLRALDTRIAPTGPEVTMLTGAYRFEPLGPERTRVTLTTTYRLATPVNFYLKPWGRLFLRDFHEAVLHVIARRAEARP